MKSFLKRRKGFSLIDFILLIIVAYLIYFYIQAPNASIPSHNKDISNKIDIYNDPQQSSCYYCKPFIKKTGKKTFTLTPVATYKIGGIVLTKNTFFIDPVANLIPIDIGIAWGQMAAPGYEYYKYLNFSHSNRRLNWVYKIRNVPFSYDYLKSHVSNNHIIPADGNILNALKSVNIYETISLEGYLVNITAENGVHVETSLIRNDWGCEIIYVTRVRIGNLFYE